MQFTEHFLHYIWQFRLLTQRNICCTDGSDLQIIDQGKPNTNAGPDFSLAKLKIGPTVWLGNIEIHIRSSDWVLHGHHLDKSYDTVILHAVYIDDFAVYRTDGTLIPVLVLKDLLPEKLVHNYLRLLNERNCFPCAPQINGVGQEYIDKMLGRVILERFEEKCIAVVEKSVQNRNHWNETFYYLLMRNFGFGVNAVPFEMLANSLSAMLLLKHRDHALQVEALLFGQAGFLNQDFKDQYPRELKAEYNFLKKKYELRPIDVSLWKFLRMRPNNFPARRIAQLAALFLHKNHFFALVLEGKELHELRVLFKPLAVNEYWESHFHFDKEVQHMEVNTGRQSVDSLIINTVCLVLYSYGKSMDQPQLIDRALSLLRQIPAEQNAIIRQYAASGITIKTAYDSQSLLHLNKSYCNQKKCLNCIIGNKILTQ